MNTTINTERSGLVFDIKRFAIYDGEGIRTTVFLKGCTLACVWCQNPEGQGLPFELFFNKKKCIECNRCVKACPVEKLSMNAEKKIDKRIECQKDCDSCYTVCPTEAIYRVGKQYTVTELLYTIEKDLPFYKISHGGVTFSGGEPLLQIEFLEGIVNELTKKDISVYIETCGDVPWINFENILNEITHFYYDIKIINPKNHEKYTGKDNERILNNLIALANKKEEITLRIPLIPEITDTERNRTDILEFIISNNLHKLDVELLPFNSLAAAKYERTGINTSDIEPYFNKHVHQQDKNELYSIKKLFINRGIKTRILSFD